MNRRTILGWMIILMIIFVSFMVTFALAVFIFGGKDILKRGDKIAVVKIKGVVTDPTQVLDILERLRKDPDIKGIVIRIDSPGGAVGPSQEIYRELRRINSEKVVVASLGSMAASGGYYIACGARKIISNPGTLTGSIGVIAQFANLEELLRKIGLKGEVVKSGPYKDMGSPYRGLTPGEREIIQGVIDDVHDQFIEAVAKGRGLPKEKVAALADGRIFSGRQAKELGLVDELGGLQDAIRLAAKMAGIEGEPVVIRPKKKRPLLDLLLKGLNRLEEGFRSWQLIIGYLYRPT